MRPDQFPCLMFDRECTRYFFSFLEPIDLFVDAQFHPHCHCIDTLHHVVKKVSLRHQLSFLLGVISHCMSHCTSSYVSCFFFFFESGVTVCACWRKVFESRIEGQRHHSLETILAYFQNSPDEFQSEIDKREFDEMMASKNPLLDQMELRTANIFSQCAGGLGSQFLLNAYMCVCLRRTQSCHRSFCCEQDRFLSQISHC